MATADDIEKDDEGGVGDEGYEFADVEPMHAPVVGLVKNGCECLLHGGGIARYLGDRRRVKYETEQGRPCGGEQVVDDEHVLPDLEYDNGVTSVGLRSVVLSAIDD